MSIEFEEGTKPHKLHPYRVPEWLKAGVKDELHKIVEDGYAVSSKRPWASPIVPEPDGTVKICVDFRKLNAATVSEPYYMSTLVEILEIVGDSCVVSKLDLAKGSYQFPLDEIRRILLHHLASMPLQGCYLGLKMLQLCFSILWRRYLAICNAVHHI